MNKCERKDCEGVTFQDILMSGYCWEAIKRGMCRRYTRAQVKGM